MIIVPFGFSLKDKLRCEAVHKPNGSVVHFVCVKLLAGLRSVSFDVLEGLGHRAMNKYLSEAIHIRWWIMLVYKHCNG